MSSPDAPDPVLVVGRYRLLGVLPRQGPLVVCPAVQSDSGLGCLVKLLLPGTVRRSVLRGFLRRSADLAALAHPALPAVLDRGPLPSGGAFLALELVRGETADTWMRRVGNLAGQPAAAAALVGIVADACHHLERSRLIHGDLRPEALVLVRHPTDPRRFSVKLLGSEDALLREAPRDARPAHRAPELSSADRAPDSRSDIYSLGCVLCEMLTGRPPFLAVGEGQPTSHRPDPPLASVAPGVPEELRRLVGRMIARSPGTRYQTMEEVVTALELILGRRRSRFVDLLRLPEACPIGEGSELKHSGLLDLGRLSAAVDGPRPERLIDRALAALQPLRTAIRAGLEARAGKTTPAVVEPRVEEPLTILVAEDDDDTRAEIVELLEADGYRVRAARHGLEAREYLRSGRPAECMVMDLWMPEMDGWALAAEMKEGRVPKVPTIVITAAEPQLGYPCSVVVRKPFDSLVLLDLVRTMAASRRPDALTPSPSASGS
jgi:CheY-like chemotaxis protein